MSTRVGEVEIYVDLDGRRVPVQTKKIAEQVGQALDSQFKGLSRRFDGVSKDIDRIGTDLERAFTLDDIGNLRQVYDTFDQIDAGARRAAIGTGAFREEYADVLDDIGELRQVRDEFDDIDGSARRGAGGVRDMSSALDDNERSSRRMRSALSHVGDLLRMMGGGGGDWDSFNRKLDDARFKWSDLGHETRQWTLIIGAVAAGMQELSVLGSAAGGGLFATGGAITSLGIGIGSTVAVFKALGTELEELPPSLRPVAAEFQQFTGVFGELRNIIAEGAFKEMPGTFTQLDRTVRALSPRFYTMGGVVGRLLDDLAKNTRPGTEGFKQLDRAVELAAPNFDSLARSSGTLGLTLIRSFNRAQPAVEGLTGYVDKLVDRLDTFSRSRSFDDWIARSIRVLTPLGGLLDATGRGLNNLVTPAAETRTVNFLNNLTGFMPNLIRLLDNLGRVDAFGLLAQGLNETGQALEPLAAPVGELADALSGKLSVGISAAADTMGLLATASVPVVTGLADLVEAVPDDVLAGLITSLGLGVTALTIFRGAAGLSGAISTMGSFVGQAALVTGASQNVSSKIASGIGRAGLWGSIAAGVFVGGAALEQFARQIEGIDDKVRNLVANNATMEASFRELKPGVDSVLDPFTDMAGALDALGQIKDPLGRIGASFTEAGQKAFKLQEVLAELDAPIASLANQNLPEASDQFRAWANELGATDDQVLNLINQMPAFKQALIDTATASGQTASDQDLVALALGRTAASADLATGATGRLGAGLAGSTMSAAETDAALALLEGRAVTTGGEIDALADKIRGFGSATLDSREANRQFEEAIAAATQAVIDNGTSLDITTAAGRANEASLDALAQKSLNAAAAALEQTGSQDQATAAINRGRDELKRVLEQFGITGQAAEDYIDKLGLVPDNVTTAAVVTGIDAAESALNSVARAREALIRARIVEGQAQRDSYNTDRARPMATGGTLYGPEYILAGEAGPEAIVPLNRPLHDVDPSVRLLSALAQGKFQLPSSTSGGGAPQKVFQAGAIVVQGAEDPRRTAIEVANEIAEDSVS